ILTLPPPSPPPFPYTTLFRSLPDRQLRARGAVSPRATRLFRLVGAVGRRAVRLGRADAASDLARHDRGTTVLARHHTSRRQDGRSEEHTSELQSHLNLVCRLL